MMPMRLSIRMGAQVEAMIQKLAVVGTPMPSTIQQIMVRNRAMMACPPETFTMVVIRVEARPVVVMQPATRPAMAQATATVTVLLPPASRASKNLATVNCSAGSSMLAALLTKLLITPTTMVTIMAMAADICMVRIWVDTRTTRTTRGSSR